MAHPERYLEFLIVKNPASSYWENEKYLESGKVLSLKVEKFLEKEIEVQLEFSNPMFVSIDPFAHDTLQVKIIDETNFISAIDYFTTAKKNSISSIEIERQLSKDQIKSADQMEKQTKMLNALLTGSLPLNLFLGLSMKYLWGMINAMHFVIYMELWKVNWPANAKLAIKTVRTIALLEFINVGKIKNKVLDYFGIEHG